MMNFMEHFLKEKYPEYDYCMAVADMEYEDKEKVKKQLGCPKHWNEISFDELKKNKEMIYFIPDKMKLYYFPLYIKYLLEKNQESRDYYIDDVFLLTLKDIDLSVMNRNQIVSLIKFLNFLEEKDLIDDKEKLFVVIKRLKDYVKNFKTA